MEFSDMFCSNIAGIFTSQVSNSFFSSGESIRHLASEDVLLVVSINFIVIMYELISGVCEYIHLSHCDNLL